MPLRYYWRNLLKIRQFHDYRSLISLILITTGLTRIFLTPVVPLDFVSDRTYGFLATVCGLGLYITTFARFTKHVISRIVALVCSSLLITWAIDLGIHSNVFSSFLCFGLILFIIAVRK